MIIKYVVWWYEKEKGKKRERRLTDEIEYNIDFDSDDHKGLRTAIYAKHPNTNLALYAPKTVFDDPEAWEKSSINPSLNPHQ